MATGKRAPGGKRPGAGRPKGPAALGYGEVKALEVANLRVPEGAGPGAQELAAQALGRLVDVMLERAPAMQAGNVLRAAVRVREEICGPLTQKVVVSGLETLTDEQLEARLKSITAKAATPPVEPAE